MMLTLQSQRFSASRASRIKVRLLAQRNSPLTRTLSISWQIVSRRMVYAPVVPDRQVIRIIPSKPDLQIMVFHNQLDEPIQQVVALCFRHFINTLSMMSDRIDAFPPGHRVGADDRMYSFQVRTHILRCAPLCAVELESILGCSLAENWLRIGGGKSFEELLVSWRNAIIDLVTGSPECISSSFWHFGKPQDSIVAWDRLEGDIAVPTLLCALLSLQPVGVECLRFFGGDDTDFVVFAAKPTSAIHYWMDVQLGSTRLSRELSKTLDKLFLQIIVQVVLLAEEYNSSL